MPVRGCRITDSNPLDDECNFPHRWNFHLYMEELADFEFELTEDGFTVYVAKVGGGSTDRIYDGAWYVLAKDDSQWIHGEFESHLGYTHCEVAERFLLHVKYTL